MDLLTLILTIGLIVRVTRLIVADQILHPVRARIVVKLGPNHPMAYLITCSWCMSVWVGAGLSAAWWAWGSERWWTAAALAGTASLAAGWAGWAEPDEVDQ